MLPWLGREVEQAQGIKKEPGSEKKIDKRNTKWLNDDYVKFIRFGQHLIDENVFNIMQGVGINRFVKKRDDDTLAEVYHHDVYGLRKHNLDRVPFQQPHPLQLYRLLF